MEDQLPEPLYYDGYKIKTENDQIYICSEDGQVVAELCNSLLLKTWAAGFTYALQWADKVRAL